MNMRKVTISDCLVMYYMKKQAVVLDDGKVIGFREEKEIPTQTANQGGDNK